MQHIRGVNGPILGKFRIAAITGLTTGMVATSSIFAARFAPTAAVRAVVTDFRLKSQILTPFTAANEISCQASIGRGWTAAPSGGIAIALTGIQNMLSSVSDLNSPTAFSQIQVANTGGMSNGTLTIDPNPFLYLPAAQIQAAASASQPYSEADYSPYSDQRFPINLQGQTGGVAANAEGIVVSIPIAQGAAGVVRYCIEMEWYEYATNSAEVIS